VENESKANKHKSCAKDKNNKNVEKNANLTGFKNLSGL